MSEVRAREPEGPPPPDRVTTWERYAARWSGEALLAAGGAVAVVLICVGLFFLSTATDADTWVPILLYPFLFLVSLPICGWLAGRPRDKRLRRLLVISLVLKLVAAGPRYYMSEAVYGGEGDAGRYHQAGGYFVKNLKQGKWSIDGSELNSFPRSTRVVGYLTGLLYVVFGTTYFGGFIIFSWLAWLGLLFFLRAFMVAMPNAPPYRACLLIMFLPSLVFWPSSTGKDALMVFLLGLLTLGASRLLANSKVLIGLVWIVIAGFAILNIRPHLLVISTAAMGLSLLSRESGHGGRRGVLWRIGLLAVLVPVLVSGLGRVDTLMGTTAGGSANINASLDETVSRTEIGGSAFKAIPVRTPWDLPGGTVTVLYRPFIFEARSVQVLISAIEGSLLVVMTVMAYRWIWTVFPAMYRNNFAAYCGGYVIGFVVAFSNISNAGILSRQRVQMFPLLMILVAIAYERRRLRLEEEAAAEAQAHAPAVPSTPVPLPGGRGPSITPAPRGL
jgi:hypothetical protein